MKARVAVAIVGTIAYLGYWSLRAMRHRAEADAIRAAGKLMVKQIRAERERVGSANG